MKPRLIHRDDFKSRPEGFFSTCAKALLVGVAAGFVGLVVGGDELRGCMVAFFTTPAVFLAAMVYFSCRPKPKIDRVQRHRGRPPVS